MTEGNCRFVAYIQKPFHFLKRIFTNYKGYGLLCSSAVFGGKSSTKWSNYRRFWFTKHKGWPEHCRGETDYKGPFARGKWDIWQSDLVWGFYHNSTPPITVFNWTTIASTIITQCQDSSHHEMALSPQSCLLSSRRALLTENPRHEVRHRLTVGLPGDNVQRCLHVLQPGRVNTIEQLVL